MAQVSAPARCPQQSWKGGCRAAGSIGDPHTFPARASERGVQFTAGTYNHLAQVRKSLALDPTLLSTFTLYFRVDVEGMMVPVAMLVDLAP